MNGKEIEGRNIIVSIFINKSNKGANGKASIA